MPRYLIDFAELESLLHTNDGTGVCVNCGELQDGCEPAAHHIVCDECDKRTVYGVEAVLQRGWYGQKEEK